MFAISRFVYFQYSSRSRVNKVAAVSAVGRGQAVVPSRTVVDMITGQGPKEEPRLCIQNTECREKSESYKLEVFRGLSI